MKEAKMTAEERSEGIKDEGKKGDEREQLVLIKHARSRSRPNHVSLEKLFGERSAIKENVTFTLEKRREKIGDYGHVIITLFKSHSLVQQRRFYLRSELTCFPGGAA